MTGLFLLLATSGCAPGAEPRLDAERAVGTATAEGTDKQHGSVETKGASADSGLTPGKPTMAAGATPKQGRAQLTAMAGNAIEGSAALKEVPEGVRIALRVKRARPGDGRVALHAAGQCPDKAVPRKQPTAVALPDETSLGTLVVNKRGEGSLDVMLQDVNLQAMQEGTLLGKALTVYRVSPPARSGERGELAVACAQILPQQ